MKTSLWLLTTICSLCLLSACGSGTTRAALMATHFSVTALATVTAGTAFSITVTALDASNNTVTTYSGTVHFTSTDKQAVLPANTTLINGAGTFSVTLKTAGAQTVTATDTVTAISGISGSINVSGRTATHLSVSAPTSAVTGNAFGFMVAALDASNNIVTNYTGTVHFASTDPQAVLPANSALTGGAVNFSATLKTVGVQTVTATDTLTASITGTSNSINVTASGALEITSGPPPSGTVGKKYDVHCLEITHCLPLVFGFVLTASGGVQPYSWSWAAAPGSSLPPGLGLSSTGLIGGTPSAAGSYNVIVTVTDSESPAVHVSANYTIMFTTSNANSADLNATNQPHPHHHYKLIDMGTFGGPQSYLDRDNGFEISGSSPLLTNGGAVTGFADTNTPDPFAPNFCFEDCYVTHVFQWRNDVLTDPGRAAWGRQQRLYLDHSERTHRWTV